MLNIQYIMLHVCSGIVCSHEKWCHRTIHAIILWKEKSKSAQECVKYKGIKGVRGPYHTH